MNHSTDAAAFVEQFVYHAESLWKAQALAYWNLATTGNARYKDETIALQVEEHRLYENPADWQAIQSYYAAREELEPVLRRQIEILYHTFLSNQSTAEENEQLARVGADVQQTFVQHRATVQGRPVSDNDISDILKHSLDEEERREAWEGSQEVGAQVAEQVRELAHLRNAIARRLGFRDHYAFSLATQEIEEDVLLDLFERLATLTEAPFAAVKAEMDGRLATRFGIPVAALRPWHYADPFFQETPPVFEANVDEFFKGRDIVTISMEAFEGMGMEVDDILQRSDLYEREGKDQHAFCINIGREDDVRVLCNLRSNARWMGTQMHELGHAVYDKYLPSSLPYLLRYPAHISSTEAMAMIMGRLPYTPAWLTDVVGADPRAVERIAAELAREHAAGMLVFCRWVLVMLHFERALYADPDRPDLNELWWSLKEKYQLLQRPAGRDAPDWAAKYHVALAPVYYHNYVLGELTASQLEAWLKRETGGSLTNNPRGGQRLIERFIVHGARYPWNELLEKTTGEPLRPGYFVEQFIGAFSQGAEG